MGLTISGQTLVENKCPVRFVPGTQDATCDHEYTVHVRIRYPLLLPVSHQGASASQSNLVLVPDFTGTGLSLGT